MKDLTKDEKNILTQLLDLATKAGGLNAAQHALYFVEKFGLAQKPKEEEVKK